MTSPSTQIVFLAKPEPRFGSTVNEVVAVRVLGRVETEPSARAGDEKGGGR
jgi:hypothetical protein